MNVPDVFKVVAFAVLAVFVVSISHLRKGPSAEPLCPRGLILLAMVLYPLPLFAYAYALATLHRAGTFDWACLTVTIFGAAVTVKARLDLGDRHVWAGYELKDAEPVTGGTYAYVRHPLYAGIFVFIFDGLPIILTHNPPIGPLLALVPLAYILPFLIVVAHREMETMASEFGEQFTRYKEEVHPFLPVRKYSPSEWE